MAVARVITSMLYKKAEKMTILPRYWMLLQRSLSFVNFSLDGVFLFKFSFVCFMIEYICLEQNDSEITLALYIRLQLGGV